MDIDDEREPPPIEKHKYEMKTETYFAITSMGIVAPVFIDHPNTVTEERYCTEVGVLYSSRLLFVPIMGQKYLP